MDDPATTPLSDPASPAARGVQKPYVLEDPLEEDAAGGIRPPDREFVYRTTPEGELKMFMYLPKGWKAGDKRPTLLFFHGGGMTAGRPSQMYDRANYFASRGMVTFSVGYRVKNVHQTNPEKSFEDSRSAMRYVRKHAATLGVDPGQVIAGGSSAGAVLSLGLAVLDTHEDPTDDLTISCRPQATVLYGLRADTAGLSHRWKDTPDEARADELALSISPYHHVKSGCSPAIMFSGGTDVYLPYNRNFAEKSITLGNRVSLYVAPDQPHGFHGRTPWRETTMIEADRFLASLGFLRGEPTIRTADEKAVLVKEFPRG